MSLGPGSRVGPHEITAKLGEGGMGEVWRATDTRLDREVAIKVLPPAFVADPERLARFEREAKLLAQLHHPHIASIFGLEDSNGTRALVMELVEGDELSTRIARGPIPVDEAITIARQIAEALEAAHEKGIVHRDLKPQNVKLTPDGTVKVLDFGLAKAMDVSSAAPTTAVDRARSPVLMHSPTVTSAAMGGGPTEPGVILGTAAYMAPEQARGNPVDRRADIWAFGVVLYEMLTGRQLFAGESASDILAAVLRQPVEWTALPQELAEPHRRLLARCLERDPKRRLRDIGEARIALEDPTLVAVAATAPVATLGRRSGLLAIVGASALAAGIGIGALGRPAATVPVATSQLRVTPITSSGNVIAAAVSPDGRYVAFVETEQGRQSLWLQQLAGGQTLRLIDEQDVAYWGHTFTPDGNQIYFGQQSDGEPRGALYAISTLGGAPRRLLVDIDSAVSFSPDGRQIAFLRGRHPTDRESALMVAGADGSRPRALATFTLPEAVAGIFYSAPAWSPDGRSIATAVARRGGETFDNGARLVLVSVQDGAVTTLADPGWEAAAQAGWLPDGRSLLVIARAPDQLTPQIWSVSHPGGESRALTTELNDRRIISLTADGRSLVTVSGSVAASVWTLPPDGSGQGRRVSRSMLDGIYGIAFAPTADLVYSGQVGDSWSLWSAGVDGAGRRPLYTAPELTPIGFPAVAADGSTYFALRTRAGVEIHVLDPGSAASRAIVRGAMFAPFAVSSDGRFLVYTGLEETLPVLFRVAADGSGRRRLFDGQALRPAVDRAGERVAFYFADPEGGWHIGVLSSGGGPLLLDLPAAPPTNQSRLVLRDEGIYLNTMQGDRSNVWLLPAAGGAARRITAYEERAIYDFAFATDGAALAVARGLRLRDAQLITRFGVDAAAAGAP